MDYLTHSRESCLSCAQLLQKLPALPMDDSALYVVAILQQKVQKVKWYHTVCFSYLC